MPMFVGKVLTDQKEKKKEGKKNPKLIILHGRIYLRNWRRVSGLRGYKTVERQEAGDEGPSFASYIPQDQKHVTGSLWICMRGLDR